MLIINHIMCLVRLIIITDGISSTGKMISSNAEDKKQQGKTNDIIFTWP